MASPIARTDSPMALRHLDLHYDSADSENSALGLIYKLLPEWERSEGKVEFIRFTDGITNTLLKAVKKRPGCSQAQIDRESVLLRAYGKGTDVIIDRERETRSHSLLASRGLAPPLLARFANGLLYKFIAGDVCSPEDLRKPHIYRAVARRMGQWHSTLPISAISTVERGEGCAAPARPKPNLWTVMQGWIEALPTETDKESDRKAALQTELDQLSKDLGKTPGLDGNDYIFGHCDLLCGNVIVTRQSPDETEVDFIDYEYATPTPAAFDIANHFAEWGGLECDYSALPTRSQRHEYLSDYLRSYRSHRTSADDEPRYQQELDQLMSQVDLFRGVPGFYWGVWALIQAQISQIDFDYASYAEVRLGEYWAWKAEMDQSRRRQDKAMPLREQRWAAE